MKREPACSRISIFLIELQLIEVQNSFLFFLEYFDFVPYLASVCHFDLSPFYLCLPVLIIAGGFLYHVVEQIHWHIP